MTTASPLANSARSVTLQPGIPTLLTEYAAGPDSPLTVINLSVGQIVYLAADSSLTTSTGVPLPPGVNVPWTAPGQIWGLVPAGGTATTVAITGAIGLLPSTPLPTPTKDVWAHTIPANWLSNVPVVLDNTDTGGVWGSTFAYINATTTASATFGYSLLVEIFQPEISNTITIANGSVSNTSPLAGSTTFTLPKSPYIVRATPNGGSTGNAITVSVQLAPA